MTKNTYWASRGRKPRTADEWALFHKEQEVRKLDKRLGLDQPAPKRPAPIDPNIIGQDPWGGDDAA